ncbi:MAG: alpha/beta fold hydrolase [Candidatus Binataceae bacterium]
MELVHAAYEPAGDGLHPAIIAFHGWGANAFDLLGLAPYVAEGRFAMLCPQGPIEVPIGPVRGYGWYQIAMGAPPDPDQVQAAADAADRFVKAALERYPIDRRKLVLLGFSQGGSMVYKLGLREPQKFAAMVAISSWFPPQLASQLATSDSLAQLPTLIQHGRADDLIDIARARESVEALRALKVPLTYREYDCGHEITGEGLADLSQFLSEKVLSPIIRLA